MCNKLPMEFEKQLRELWKQIPQPVVIHSEEIHEPLKFSTRVHTEEMPFFHNYRVYNADEVDEWIFGKLEAILLKYCTLYSYSSRDWYPPETCDSDYHSKLMCDAITAVKKMGINYLPNVRCNRCGAVLLT